MIELFIAYIKLLLYQLVITSLKSKSPYINRENPYFILSGTAQFSNTIPLSIGDAPYLQYFSDVQFRYGHRH